MTEFKLGLVVRAIDQATKPLQGIAKAAQNLAGRTGLGKVARAGAEVGRTLGPVFRETRKLALLAGGAATAMGGAVFGLAKSFADAGDRAGKMAKQLGVNVEWLQRMQGAAKLADIPTSTFNMALQRLTRRAAEAAAGQGEAAGALKHLGIQLTDSTGKVRPMADLLPEISDAMAKVEDPALRTRIAFKLFDSEGVQMIKMLGDGSKAMAAQAAEAERLGMVIGGKGVRDSAAFNDSMTKLGWAVQGVRNIVGAQLLPLITPLIDRVTEWTAANRELIGTKVEGFLSGLAKVVPPLAEGVASVARAVYSAGEAVAPVVERLGGLKTVGAGLAALLGGKLLFAILGTGWASLKLAKAVGVSVVKAFGLALPVLKSLGAALWATPLGWFLGAVAAIGGAAYVIYDQWDAIVGYFEGLWAGVQRAFERGWLRGVVALLDAFNPVALVADGINGLIRYLTGVDLAAAGGEMIRGLADGISAGVSGVLGIVQSLADTVSGIFSGLWNGVRLAGLGVKSMFLDVIGEIVGRVNDFIGNLPEFLTNRIGGLESIGGFAQRIQEAQAATEQQRQRLRAEAGAPAAPGTALSGRDGRDAAQPTAPGGRLDLNLRIDQDGRARVRDLTGDAEGVRLNVDAGTAMVGN